MTDLPLVDDLTNPSVLESAFQVAIGKVHQVVNELPGGGGAPETLTITGGLVTPNKGIAYVDTEGAAATDDLTNIVPANLGQKLLTLKIVSAARVVTLKHNVAGAGKLNLRGAADAILDGTAKWITFLYVSASNEWVEIARNWGLYLPTTANKTAARTELGLGTAATLNVAAGGTGDLLRADGDASALQGLPQGDNVGTIKITLNVAPDVGYLLLNNQTIGSAASAATLKLDAYQNLFLALWALPDAVAPVPGGRGASGAADWAANKSITLPDCRGRAIIGSGQGVGLLDRTHGAKGGSQNAIVVSHNHDGSGFTITGGNHGHGGVITSNTSAANGQTGAWVHTITDGDGPVYLVGSAAGATPSHGVGGTTGAAGASGTDANMMPFIAFNFMIKF